MTLAGLVSRLLPGIVALAPFSTDLESEFGQHARTARVSWSPDVIVEDDSFLMPVDSGDVTDNIEIDGETKDVVRNEVLIGVGALSDSELSSILRTKRLLAMGLVRDFWLLGELRETPSDSSTLPGLIADLRRRADLEGIEPNSVVQSFDGNFVGQRIPFIPEADGGTPSHYLSDFQESVSANGVRVANGGFRFLEKTRHLHLMSTFAAHGLEDRILALAQDKTVSSHLAVIDSGFGNGTGIHGIDLNRIPSGPRGEKFAIRPRVKRVANAAQLVGVHFGLDRAAEPNDASHGTGVLAAACGDAAHAPGAVFPLLGISRRSGIVPVAIGIRGKKGFDTATVILSMDFINRIPEIRVVNLSLGGSRNQFMDAAIIRLTSKGPDPKDPKARDRGTEKIVVCAAGQTAIFKGSRDFTLTSNRTENNSPVRKAPTALPRPETGNGLIVVVGQHDVDSKGEAIPLLSQVSGDHIALTAPFPVDTTGLVASPNATDSVAPIGTTTVLNGVEFNTGTSFTAPLVAGLLAELIVVEGTIRKNPLQFGNRDAFMPIDFVETVEFTADRVTTKAKSFTVNDGKTNEVDVAQVFGRGRVNHWKALLTVVNGGPPQETTPDSKKFPSLTKMTRTIAQTSWYGVDVRSSTPNAIAGVLLPQAEPVDFSSVAATTNANRPLLSVDPAATPATSLGRELVAAFLAVPPISEIEQIVPSGAVALKKLNPSALVSHDFLLRFSAPASRLVGGTLFVGPPAAAADLQSSFDYRIDLGDFKAIRENKGGARVRFDDYVIRIQVPVLRTQVFGLSGSKFLRVSLRERNGDFISATFNFSANANVTLTKTDLPVPVPAADKSEFYEVVFNNGAVAETLELTVDLPAVVEGSPAILKQVMRASIKVTR